MASVPAIPSLDDLFTNSSAPVDGDVDDDEDITAQEWQDVTNTFNDATKEMSIGEMVHSKKFTLLSAMSAIQLMDPKMDVGYGQVRDLNEIKLPQSLSHIQAIHIMDRLFAHEMSWLDSHTLAQTVFSCVYVHRMYEIPRDDLLLFTRLQLATMDVITGLIVEEKVADEEDFVQWTFGFRLLPLECRHAENELEVLNEMVEQALLDCHRHRSTRDDEENRAMTYAILMRLKLRVAYYYTLRCLAGHYSKQSPFDTAQSLDVLSQLLEQWASCPYRLSNCQDNIIDHGLLNLLFDVSINRHLMTSTPPRTAPLFDTEAALSYFKRLLDQLNALLALRRLALPPHLPSSASSSARPRYSLHVAIHAVESFCAIHRPIVLTRAFMSRLILMIPEHPSFIFDNDGATFSQMIATDMGISVDQLNENSHAKYSDNEPSDDNSAITTIDVSNKSNTDESEKYNPSLERKLDSMRDAVVSIFECFCRNRSRQRRRILRVLRWWDHCAFAASHSIAQTRSADDNFSRLNSRDRMGSILDEDDDDDDIGAHIASSSSTSTSPDSPSITHNGKQNTSDTTENSKQDLELAEQASRGMIDHSTNAEKRKDTENENGNANENDEKSASTSSIQSLEGKSPLQLVAYEVCCRLMVQHWLLGFECELYHEYEYSAIFFYIGYVLSNLSSATTALAQCGLQNAELHPLRFALHLMDEARLWICRALYLLIGALSSGDQWDYTSQRDQIHKGDRKNRLNINSNRKMFGSEALWYEQRFGVVMGLVNAPPYANYSSFIAFSNMQRDSILQQYNSHNEKDVIALRLQEAGSFFVAARRKLEKSKKFAQSSLISPDNFLVDEILKLGRVTVENSLNVTQILRDYLKQRKLKPKHRSQYSVSFVFSRHPHFPVIKVAEKT